MRSTTTPEATALIGFLRQQKVLLQQPPRYRHHRGTLHEQLPFNKRRKNQHFCRKDLYVFYHVLCLCLLISALANYRNSISELISKSHRYRSEVLKINYLVKTLEATQTLRELLRFLGKITYKTADLKTSPENFTTICLWIFFRLKNGKNQAEHGGAAGRVRRIRAARP